MVATTSASTDVSAGSSLPAEMLDAIADLLVHAPDPGSRAAIVTTMVCEIYNTAAWLANGQGSQELASMGQVVAEAQAHHARMTASSARTAAPSSEVAAVAVAG